MDRVRRAYEAPELRVIGTLSGLTMGMNGSCPDGGSRTPDTQLGGASGCGVSGDNQPN